jgi:hypothetical protein
METTMQANVRFAYWAETADEQDTVELTVRAQVEPGIPAVTDRRPEHCHEGEPAEVLDVEVLDENLQPLTITQIGERFAGGTYGNIIREVLRSRVELPDPV